MSKSIVLELQEEIISKDCDVVSALRKAHIIAKKLNLDEFGSWVINELNGYKNKELVPDYRNVKGLLKGFNPYNGWIPIMIPDGKLDDMINNKRLNNPISELVDLYNNSNSELYMTFSGEILQSLNNMLDIPFEIQIALFINKTQVKKIIEQVKDNLLQWTLKLEEKGILGESMRFSKEEKNNAKAFGKTVNNFNGQVTYIVGNVNDSLVVNGSENNIEIDYPNMIETVKEAISFVNKQNIEKEQRDSIIEMLTDISEKLEKRKSKNVIKAALVGLKDLVVGFGLNVLATYFTNQFPFF